MPNAGLNAEQILDLMKWVKRIEDRVTELEATEPPPVQLNLSDGITAPSTKTGLAQIYVDASDGDLKVKFGDGHVEVIAADS